MVIANTRSVRGEGRRNGDLCIGDLGASADWGGAGQSKHFVQFYETEAFLLNELSNFVAMGLASGEACIVVATRDHCVGLEDRLQAIELDLGSARAAGKYIVLDAAETLSSFMVNGALEPGRFFELIGGLITRTAMGQRRVRIFGEMVALLWAQGSYDQALQLEGLWNSLLETHPSLLFCAYPLNDGGEEALALAMHNVCGAHTHVIPAESYTLTTPDELHQAIVLLQQKARWYEAEIAERKQAEAELRTVKEELELQVADLARLHEMSVRLSSTLDVETILEEVLQSALAMQGTDLGLLSLCDPQHDGLNVKVSRGFDNASLKAFVFVPSGSGACGRAYQQQRRVIVEDVEADPIFAPYREIAHATGFRSIHSTPLVTHGGKIIGVLSAHYRYPRRPTEREMRLMDLYARMAADSIEHARLHQQLQQELAEREQLLAREQQARADAQAAVQIRDVFLSVAAHELKTPLTSLMGNAELMQRRVLREGVLSERDQRSLRIIMEQAARLNKMVMALLDVSRIETGQLSIERVSVDLCALARRVVDEIQPTLDKHVVDCYTMGERLMITGDELRLEQVLQNLLMNAVKYSPDGGPVRVRIERQGQQALLRVIDMGMGIPKSEQPLLFQRFYRASNASTWCISGMGIGLYVVKEIVTLHRGTIELESSEGGGSTFTVCLPIDEECQEGG